MTKVWRDRKGRILHVVGGIRGKGGFTTGWWWPVVGGTLRKTAFRELDAPSRREAQRKLDRYAKEHGLTALGGGERHVMLQTYIQRHPPQDGREYDAQCARCGSTWDIFEDTGCLSSREWCEANPLPGRENQRPGPEWFEVDETTS